VLLGPDVTFRLGSDCERQLNWPQDAVERFRFEVVTPRRTYHIYCDSQEAAVGWFRSLQEVVGKPIQRGTEFSSNAKMSALRKSAGISSKDLKTYVQGIAKKEGNSRCFDCHSTEEVTWTSCNLGVFICFKCMGLHKELVPSSNVRSVLIDKWTISQRMAMEHIGNKRARAVYDAKLPADFVRFHTESD
jgi:hypothetical protein